MITYEGDNRSTAVEEGRRSIAVDVESTIRRVISQLTDSRTFGGTPDGTATYRCTICGCTYGTQVDSCEECWGTRIARTQ